MKSTLFQFFVPGLLAFALIGGIVAPAPVFAQDEEAEEGDRSLAQRWLERMRNFGQPNEHQKSHTKVMEAFREVVAPTRGSTVAVLAEDKPLALGAVVSADGLIVTKASELKSEIECGFSDGTKLPAALIGVHDEHDLALLKVEATDLTPVEFADSAPEIGAFLVTSGIDENPVAIGVASAISRKINPKPGVLGIQIEEGDDGPRVAVVMPRSGAQKAGVKEDDIVLSLNGKRTKTREKLIETVRTYKPGEKVKLKIRRDGEEMELEATLGARFTGPGAGRGDFQNNLGSSLSNRREGFAEIIQHDTVLKANQCGGPIVNLDGRVVGLNIARAGRVVSYALPAKLVSVAVDELKSGKFDVEMTDTAAEKAIQIAELQRQIDEAEAAMQSAKNKAARADELLKIANEAFKKAQTAKNNAKKAADEEKKFASEAEGELTKLREQLQELERE